jgi:hypothetical protein
MTASHSDTPPIRLFLELDRNDDPLLYDELLRFRKGTKRVNRLRLLAHDGLYPHADGQRAFAGNGSSGPGAASLLDPTAARLTGHAFDPPGQDDDSP